MDARGARSRQRQPARPPPSTSRTWLPAPPAGSHPQSDLLGQLERIVVDPQRRADPLPIGGHPHDHATTPVQVYTHKLAAVILVHKGPPSSWYVVTTPENNR